MVKLNKNEANNSFDDLYKYVKDVIFEYDESQKLPKYMILRLKGLKEGKFIANNKVKTMADYEYSHILYTFKINKLKIKQIAQSQNFNNEQHKFNTIMLIIEKEINDVVNRIKRIAKAEEKIESIELENVFHEGAKYKSKNKKIEVNNELDELW